MASNLNKIAPLIEEVFPTDWYVGYDFEQGEFSQEIYDRFMEKILKSKEDIFQLLNSSILIGEYIRSNDFLQNIKTIKTKIQGITQILPTSVELQDKLNDDFNKNYIECLKVALNMYLEFVVWVQVKIKLSAVDYIDQSNDELTDSIEDTQFNPESYRFLIFLQANFSIAKKDHDLTTDVSDYKYLYQISRELLKQENLGGNRFSLLLREKVNFLLTKWILRKKDINGFPVHHIKDGVPQELTAASLSSSYFITWDNLIQSHYEFAHHWPELVEADFNVLRNKPLTDLKIIELHRLIKYFKDVTKSSLQLKSIREEIQRRYEEAKGETCDYNVFVYSVLINYAANNEFSLVVESEDYQKIIEHYENVVEIQSITGIANFFPQHKVMKYLLKILKKSFDNKSVLTDLESIRTYIAKSKEIVAKYRRNVTWSEKNYNYTFYLPSEECLIETGPGLKRIFIASSFVLPLDKKQYVDDFDIFSKELYNIDSSLAMVENVESELNNIRAVRKDVESVKRSLQATETKSMETIGIFTTIVTFVLASVSNFKFIESAYQAALFTLCLALSLGLFVFLLLIIREGDIAAKMRRYFLKVLLSTCVLIFFWIILIFSSDIKDYIKPITQADTNSMDTIALDSLKSSKMPAIDTINIPKSHSQKVIHRSSRGGKT